MHQLKSVFEAESAFWVLVFAPAAAAIALDCSFLLIQHLGASEAIN